jgi:hypothetical protein
MIFFEINNANLGLGFLNGINVGNKIQKPSLVVTTGW